MLVSLPWCNRDKLQRSHTAIVVIVQFRSITFPVYRYYFTTIALTAPQRIHDNCHIIAMTTPRYVQCGCDRDTLSKLRAIIAAIAIFFLQSRSSPWDWYSFTAITISSRWSWWSRDNKYNAAPNADTINFSKSHHPISCIAFSIIELK